MRHQVELSFRVADRAAVLDGYGALKDAWESVKPSIKFHPNPGSDEFGHWQVYADWLMAQDRNSLRSTVIELINDPLIGE